MDKYLERLEVVRALIGHGNVEGPMKGLSNEPKSNSLEKPWMFQPKAMEKIIWAPQFSRSNESNIVRSRSFGEVGSSYYQLGGHKEMKPTLKGGDQNNPSKGLGVHTSSVEAQPSKISMEAQQSSKLSDNGSCLSKVVVYCLWVQLKPVVKWIIKEGTTSSRAVRARV